MIRDILLFRRSTAPRQHATDFGILKSMMLAALVRHYHHHDASLRQYRSLESIFP